MQNVSVAFAIWKAIAVIKAAPKMKAPYRAVGIKSKKLIGR